jgi:hypothetical protein
MKPFHFVCQVGADPARTFEAFTDLRRADQRISGIRRLEVLTDGPIRKGTRFRETRIVFNREATEEMEVTDFQPGRSYAVACQSCGMAWSSTFRFSPEAGGTRVELEMNTRPITILARLMSPLGALMAGSVRKCVEQDMNDLRRYLESGATS